MQIDVLTPFPEMINSVSGSSIARIAAEKKLAYINALDLRQYTTDKHKKVDNYPFGGGDGMIMMAQPFISALEDLKSDNRRVIYPTPDGKLFNQKKAEELSKEKHLVFLCGHYKGIDQRIRDHYVDEEISLGDFVLTGGEIASLVIIDALIRLIPGVLGTLNSAQTDSFSHPLLDCPWYTRPEEFQKMKVPDVLLSGHHANIDAWRDEERLRKTKERRPDLYKQYIEEYIQGDKKK
ncbi:MAG: tRNA (guanosine(37)-N1)-methyltransferase TrmD [Candidatus Marinimicrobia bacterium]|nr:tRNA (guanosine(37)-N1)-methyltransferase TrmD [Candidatus Neomarinimicrobiota bacterium]